MPTSVNEIAFMKSLSVSVLADRKGGVSFYQSDFMCYFEPKVARKKHRNVVEVERQETEFELATIQLYPQTAKSTQPG